MRVVVIGGSGAAGSRIVAESLRRGHEVRVASRRAGVRVDAVDADAVESAIRGADVVVGATRPSPGREADVQTTTSALAAAAGRREVRLLVVGGAAPLRVPGTDRIALDDPTFVPVSIRAIAASSVGQLETLRTLGRQVDWTYLAPAADFRPGELRGRYRVGRGELVVASDGTSAISMEDFALAACDEMERSPAHRRSVVSVGW